MSKTETPATQSQPKPKPLIPPDEYQKYIGNVQIENIRLVNLEASRSDAPTLDSPTRLSFDGDHTHRIVDDRIYAEHTGKVSLKLGRKVILKVKTVYELEYRAKGEMPDGFLDIFLPRSVPLHIWPFVRQTVHDLTSKMGMPCITLPVRVIGRLATEAVAVK